MRHYLFFALFLPYSFLLAGPAWISDAHRSHLDLGGEWEVQPIAGLAFDYPPPAGGWKKETVPADSTPSLSLPGNPYGGEVPAYLPANEADFGDKSGLAAWFRRSFEFPGLPDGKRALMRFQGLSFRSEIWLNGKKIGGSLIGQVPAVYDVTDAIRKGINELVVGLTSHEGLIDVANRTFLAPVNGSPAGIWGKVELVLVPDIRVEDVFVQTSVKDKRIAIEVEVVNQSSQTRKIAVGARVADVKQVPEAEFAPVDVELAPGESKKVTLRKDWIAPQLWSLNNPALYYATVTLTSGKEELDEKATRFGFREFEVRGFNFYLNGERVVLLRESMLAALPTRRDQVFSEMRDKAGGAINCIRLHMGFNSDAVLDLCDELGLLAIPESSWFTLNNKFRLDKRDLWIPNVQNYIKELIRQHRNRPSVAMWSLTNETAWGNTTPEHLEVADAVLSAARVMDTTRPFVGDGECDWGGKLDSINIHYPEGSVENSLRSQYPNSGFVYPNDFYWLTRNQKNTTSRADFTWDRPLVVGEYFYPSGDPDKLSAFMGDSIYDWEKWRTQRLDGRDSGPLDASEFVRTQQGLADAYRRQGVAGLNPWASDPNKLIPKVAVRPVDFFPNAFSGSQIVRKFVVFNEKGVGFNSLNLQCRLTVDGETVWEKNIPVEATSGEGRIVELPVQCPVVERPVEAELRVRLRKGEGVGFQLDRQVLPLFILPRPSLADLTAASVVLFDTTGKTSAALKTLGLDVEASSSLSAGGLQGIKTLIIGEDSDAAPFKELVADFARSGGSVVVLRQDQWTPLAGELPEIDKEHVSTRAWRRAFDHPLTRDLDDRQLSYWRPDHLVSRKTFRKPSAGRYRLLLDSGGLFGLRWSPLLEVPVGKGTFILTSLDLASRVGVEPAAAQLLANIVRYAGSYQPPHPAPLRLFAGDNPALRAALSAAGVVFTEGIEGVGPILMDATFEASKPQIDAAQKFLADGGSVWLHGFDATSSARIAGLLPFPSAFESPDPSVQSATVLKQDPLMDNLASFDFFWTRADLEARLDYFEHAQPTAKLGDAMLKLPSLHAGQRLLNPGFLVRIPAGKGTILFDTLLWEAALGAESEKVTRIVAALAGNLGAEVRTATDEERYDLFPIDISNQANMAYYDAVANDGKGGWTDQGGNDMRFFLINHLGKGGGLESGMDIEWQEFPAEVALAGRTFWLLDPRKTGDRAVISLRGGDHGALLPGEVTGIPVNRKADALWFLNAAAWTPDKEGQEVASYIIHYTDGSKAIFPIRYGQEVSEWWNPRPLSRAKVAWTGNNLKTSPIGIYATEWKNPSPEKQIATIDVIGNLSPVQFQVLAITGGTASVDALKATLLGRWNLSDFSRNQVPNQIEGRGSLRADPDSAPVPAEGGLHFQSGQRLSGNLKTLPERGGLGTGKPFSVKLAFKPLSAPESVCGGLFEAMGYGSAGFRLVLNKDLKLGVEAFLDDSGNGQRTLVSSAPLELGRNYTVEVRFDGIYATLLIDGRVDQMLQMPLPGKFDGNFTIGVASGNQYDFTGVITEASLFGLPPSSREK